MRDRQDLSEIPPKDASAAPVGRRRLVDLLIEKARQQTAAKNSANKPTTKEPSNERKQPSDSELTAEPN
jgi:hypothetical protein